MESSNMNTFQGKFIRNEPKYRPRKVFKKSLKINTNIKIFFIPANEFSDSELNDVASSNPCRRNDGNSKF